jgi:hypothetical protein
MNDPTQKYSINDSRAGTGDFEETLRQIAQLPAPMGLADRVQAGLRASQLSGARRERVLHWPAALRPGSDWMRSAAAAAIVFVVAGGGWGVYTRVQQHQPVRVMAMPRVGAQGGFGGANARRTPITLNGPVLANPAPAKIAQGKAPSLTGQKPVKRAHSDADGKVAAQRAANPAK